MKYTKDQLNAINTLDKNLQIIACAGSGKTQVISQRIVNILKKGTLPSNIIAFTYTEKAAAVYADTTPLTAEDIAETVTWAATLPEHVNVNTMEVMPTKQTFSPLLVERDS